MAAINIDMVQRIAIGLGDLKEKVVFVGGSVAELYAAYPEVSDIRPTLDVDCVVDIQISTYLDYSKLEEELRILGFRNDITAGAPGCRMTISVKLFLQHCRIVRKKKILMRYWE